MDSYLAGFIFFSTILSYSFHWYLTSGSVIYSDRINWLQHNRNIHVILFFIGLAGSCVFFIYLLEYWHWLLVAAVATFLYSAPKIPHRYFRSLLKIAIGKTIFLAFVWTYVTAILPVIISDVSWEPGSILFVIGRFFLIYAICILFDYRDRQDDKVAGIRSLITYLDEKGITWMFVVSLLVFAAATLLLLNYGYSIGAIILLLIPGVLVASLHNYARYHYPDMLYYFVLDGCMALSALLMLVAPV